MRRVTPTPECHSETRCPSLPPPIRNPVPLLTVPQRRIIFFPIAHYSLSQRARELGFARPGMNDILSAALSTDNTIRRRAEATLSYLRTQRGFSVALAKRLSRTGGDATDDPGGQIGSLAGVLLQHFVTDLWEVADHSVLPREDKAQVSNNPATVWYWCRGPTKKKASTTDPAGRLPPCHSSASGVEKQSGGLDFFFLPEHTDAKTTTLVPSLRFML